MTLKLLRDCSEELDQATLRAVPDVEEALDECAKAVRNPETTREEMLRLISRYNELVAPVRASAVRASARLDKQAILGGAIN